MDIFNALNHDFTHKDLSLNYELENKGFPSSKAWLIVKQILRCFLFRLQGVPVHEDVKAAVWYFLYTA